MTSFSPIGNLNGTLKLKIKMEYCKYQLIFIITLTKFTAAFSKKN